MSDVKRYLAEIGRRGGIRSRRSLDSITARRMVAIREARRTALRANNTSRVEGVPRDTSPRAQAVQDAILRRTSPSEKLEQVARLSRMVDDLSMAGIKQRYATPDHEELRFRRAELRLGRELAIRVHGTPRDLT